MTSDPAVPEDGGDPPFGGKSNAEDERSPAGKARAEPSRVRIFRGSSGRDKTAFVDGAGATRVLTVLLPPSL